MNTNALAANDNSAGKDMFEIIRSLHTWFTSQKFAIPMLIILAVIDIGGFLQIAAVTINEHEENRLLIVSAFAVAFEVAPLYIGYAISLKCYKLGRNIHTVILIFSTVACVLGVAGNVMYRVMTMDAAYRISENANTVTAKVALPMTILMCVLPVITSLINIVIGCLSYDPLLFDLLHISKKLSRLHAAKRDYESRNADIPDGVDVRDRAEDSENERYKIAQVELMTQNMRLKNHVAACTMAAYRKE